MGDGVTRIDAYSGEISSTPLRAKGIRGPVLLSSASSSVTFNRLSASWPHDI
jgi:hypothetical protein